MPDPEIARRCLQCGAAVRARAQFCPQCGSPMAGAAVNKEHRQVADQLVAAEANATDASNDTDEEVGAIRVVKRERPAASAPQPRIIVTRGERERPSRKQQAEERIGRVRDQSLVVLDEAADDPSLRLVLVAFLLFAVFVVLLLLGLALR